MAKARTLDVWIIQSNTVYREVPFAVVTDWVQQGRLLEEDKVRASGTNQWARIGSVPDFVPYLPKAEPFRAEDRAEALEPVEVEVQWKPRREEGDDDVDMIPLIDISLVLLIFFMMTAAVGGGASILIPTPPAEYKLITLKEGLWVGISGKPENPVYSFGMGDSPPEAGNQHLTHEELQQKLKVLLQDNYTDVRVRAGKSMPFDLIKQLVGELEAYRPANQNAPARGIRRVYAEVTEKERS
jgi:biopolymer transport protein ExbD